MTVQTPPHPTETQCQQYLRCYWPDFDETLKVRAWEDLEQIPTVMVTFFSSNICPGNVATFVHISIISAAKMTQCWPKFFDPIFVGLNFCRQLFFDQTSLGPNIFLTQNFFLTQIFLTYNSFLLTIFATIIFFILNLLTKFFRTWKFWIQNLEKKVYFKKSSNKFLGSHKAHIDSTTTLSLIEVWH